MRQFHCDNCSHVVEFSAQVCPQCASPLGYVSASRAIRPLRPTAHDAVFETTDGELPLWRCLNAAWGCNWMVPTGSETPWCRSCQLTRGRPDEARPDAVAAWTTAEAAKRRLVYQLDELGLPIDIRSPSAPDGLVFDLVYLPGEGGITGHLDGVVTLDLAETDDRHRDELRRQLGEPFRTVIGHLRHEVGHYYWQRLVEQAGELANFRRLFGDERTDYQSAVERHYASGTDGWDPNVFVTSYAASHPLEDWAESFAHYLHILDTLDTAAAYGLAPEASCTESVDSVDFDRLLDRWRPIATGVNAIAESLGVAAVYPFDMRGEVIDKLAFVHRQVTAHTERDVDHAIA